MLAQVLNTAAFGNHRIIVVRYRQEVGAFVSMDDLEFLRRYRPGAESSPSEQALRERRWLELLLAMRKRSPAAPKN